MTIATRTLKLNVQAGIVDVPINIFMPEQDGDGWICQYEINWPDKTWRSAAGGVDAVQALHCAMEKIGIELYASAANKSGLLTWSSHWKGFGFPVPHNARNMLVGDDAKFF